MSSSISVMRELTPPPLFCLARHCGQCETVHQGIGGADVASASEDYSGKFFGKFWGCKLAQILNGLRVGGRFPPLVRDGLAGGSGTKKADPLKGRPVVPIVSGVASIQATTG